MATLVQTGLTDLRTTAIVVNYNAGDGLVDCVEALLAAGGEPQVRVVDNASSDDSVERLRTACGNHPRLRIEVNSDNTGYGPAVNAGLRGVDSEAVLIINPDCRLEPAALTLLCAALEADPAAGLAAPLVLGPDGHPERAALRRFPGPRRSFLTLSGLGRFGGAFEGIHLDVQDLEGDAMEAEAVSGACMLLRHAAWLKVGGFDEAYRLHCEDLDLMYRLRQAGWRCLLVPRARAVHQQGVSSRSRPAWVHRQKHAGMARFFGKFQAPECSPPLRWLVYTGIWLHYLLLLPLVFIRR